MPSLNRNREHLVNAKRRSALLLCCVNLLCAAACYGANVQPGDRDYPQKNPTPTQFLFLHGTIDSSLDINFRIEWVSDIQRCRYATSIIQGAYTWYSASFPIDVARENTKFSARIPIDGVLPGRCQWRFSGVTFGGNTGWRTALIATNSYPLRPSQSPNGIAELFCKWGSDRNPGGSNQNLSCRWPKEENHDAAVLGGILWWHPQATELEVRIRPDSVLAGPSPGN